MLFSMFSFMYQCIRRKPKLNNDIKNNENKIKIYDYNPDRNVNRDSF